MKIKRYNYPAQFGDRLNGLAKEIEKMLVSGHYVLSQQVSDFEAEFAKFLGVKYVLGVNSGTDALLLALMASGIGPGDEVITQANTFHATVAAICLCGAKPVLVDVTDDSFQINVDQIEQAISSRTKAIVPVHLYGYPQPLDTIKQIAEQNDFALIEDAAQAHGALVNKVRVGAIGSIGCFSFHPSKNLAAAGDGGAIATNSDEIASRVRELRSLGQASQNNHVKIGLNSKLDAIQAAVLNSKLPSLDQWNQQRREVATLYRDRLSGLPLSFQSGENIQSSVFHLFQTRTRRRNQLLEFLRDNQVDAVTRYPVAIHLQPSFVDCGWKLGQFPVAEQLADELLCLPIRPDMEVDEVDFVCDKVHDFFQDI